MRIQFAAYEWGTTADREDIAAALATDGRRLVEEYNALNDGTDYPGRRELLQKVGITSRPAGRRAGPTSSIRAERPIASRSASASSSSLWSEPDQLFDSDDELHPTSASGSTESLF